MTVDPRRSGAELRARRERLGLTVQEFAAYLDLSDRPVRRWEQGLGTVPPGIIAELGQLEALHDDLVDDLAQKAHGADGQVVTFLHDEDWWESGGDRRLPSRWHRIAAARAVRRLNLEGWPGDNSIVYEL